MRFKWEAESRRGGGGAAADFSENRVPGRPFAHLPVLSPAMANNVPAYENSVPKTLPETWGWGCYPPGYDRKVHGPYNPGTYYGPKDPLAEVKMSELLQWIGRRNKSPRALAALMSRAHYRWADKFVQPRKAGFAPMLQIAVLTSIFSYCVTWKTLQHHKRHKYHW